MGVFATKRPLILIGAGLSAFWIIGVICFFTFVPEATSSAPLTKAGKLGLILSILLPLVLIWCVVLVAQILQELRQETQALRQALRQVSGGGSAADAIDPAVQSQLAEIANLTRQTDNRVSELAEQALRASDRPAAPRDVAALQSKADAAPDVSEQPALPLSDTKRSAAPPITVAEFIRALNFPRTAEDVEGFRILRRALDEPRLTKLLNSAQTLLSDLSEDRIYMDDLHPDLPMARVWRRFSKGERGITISALGGIRDRSAISLTKARMKADARFRENAHVFLREFDAVLRSFEPSADDDELTAMADTRTARGFMLIGRIAGTFD